MNLEFKPEAEDALFEMGMWVEKRNTSESGIRFINKFIDKISRYALPDAVYLLCKNQALAERQLCYIAINDWVVAFKKTKKEFVVFYILYGPGLR